MRNSLLGRLSSLLLPLGLYGASATAGSTYQRTYLSSSISASTGQLLRTRTALPRDLIDLSGDGLDIQTAHPVRELVIVDGAVAEADKSVLRRALKPGVQLVELDSSAAGLPQLINALGSHKNLAAIHVVSHAEAGAILLGNSRITPESIQREVHAFAALKGAVREGGDLLFYGCDLAANEAGEELLDIISNKTGLDVAASNNLTGNSELQGDWDLEVTRGNIESTLAFSEKALRDFSGVLAPFTGTVNFSQTKNAGDYYGNATVNAEVWATGTSGYFLIIDGATRATELYTGLGSSGQAAFTLNTENSVTLRFNNNEPFSPQSLKVANIAGGGGTTHSFTFTSNKGSFSQNVVNGTPATIDLTSFGANVTYVTISSTLVYAWMDDFSVVGVGITVDETAPVFQNGTPSVGSQTLSGATLSADLDEEGSVYYVVVADGAGAPSAAQVRAGQNSSGAAALASGNFTTTSTTGSQAFSGLSSGTNYDLYVVAQDDEGTPNVQASATLVNFTTQAANSDATLTAAGGVAEPIGLATTIDSVGEAVDLFDFTITDGGTSDGLATTVSQIVVNVSGTSTDAERSKITWRLNGPDASNVTGTYNAGADTITFSGLSISVADGGNETYTFNAYYNDNTALTEDRTIILSVDGDTNLTVGGSGTQMASGQSAVTNGSGTTIDVVASQLVFTTQPAGSVSGAALTTQPVVAARDAFGNTDVDFTETITLTEASAGTLANGTQAATAGVATFTNLTYTATADQQAFTLTANDQDGVGSNLSTVDANSVTSDVVATQLVFATQPAPTSVVSGQSTSFTTVPVVSARDANSVVDTGYSTGITLAEVNGAGSATMTGTGDTDGNGATVSITPSSGVSTFTGMQITYTNSGAGSETFNLRASSGGLTTADSSQLTAAATPTVTDGNISISGASGAGGAYKIGDTVTATWNNTAGGDNNAGITGVTVNFSQFGGGAAVVATNSSDTWTATYTIVSGSIDTTNRNVSVTATNASGDSSTADTTNATVDNVAPVVTNGSISISGATGAGGAYKIGDTVTATWNNTAGGDNNSDIIAATVNFSAFGGGAAVAATNGAGTWTATYTIVAGAISAANLNISVTATDNAGNATTAADTTNATVDNVAPTVGSVSVPANGTYVAGSNLSFTVNFSENVTVNTTGGTPRLTLTVGAATVYADYLSGSGTSAIVFRYVVTAGRLDTDGIAVGAAIDLNSGTVRDGVGNDVVANLNSVGSTAAVLVDATAPTVTSVSVPANATYAAASNLNFTVNFSENVTVNTTGGTPRLPLTIGTTTVYADYLSGSGSSAIVFRYTVASGLQDADGIAVGAAISLNGGTIKDASSNDIVTTLNSVGSTAAVLVDSIVATPAVVPDAPTIGTAVAGNAQATVSFTPGADGNAPITGYTVTSSPPGGVDSNAGGTSTSRTITGLTNYTAYTFTVTARNRVGDSPASAPSNSVTPSGVAPVCTLAASPAKIAAGGFAALTASCTPAATSYAWTNAGFGATVASGTVSPTTTTTYGVIGSNSAGAGNSAAATVTVQLPVSTTVPVCSLTASPFTIGRGRSTYLFASCSPAATSYVWTNSGFSDTSAGGKVTPAATTTYTVTGSNAKGAGNTANATVIVSDILSSAAPALFVNASISENKTSSIRITNTADKASVVSATAFDEAGNLLGNPNATLGPILANQTLTFSSADLERAMAFTPAAPTAKYTVYFYADLPALQITNYTRDNASGALTLGQAVHTDRTNSTASNVTRSAWLVHSSSSANKSSVVRLVNTSDQPGTLNAMLFDELTGATGNPVAIAPRQMISYTSAELERAFGFQPTATGKYRVVFTADLPSLELINFSRDVTSGVVSLAQAQIDDRPVSTAATSTRNVLSVLAASHPVSTTVLRIINPSLATAAITATAYDEAGAVLGSGSLGSIPGTWTLTLTSSQIETLLGYRSASSAALTRLVLNANVPDLEVLNHSQLRSDSSLTLTQAQTDNRSAGTPAATTTRHAYIVYPSTHAVSTTELRLINTGTQTATLTATAYADSGTLIGSQEVGVLKPNQMLSLSSAQLERALEYVPGSGTISRVVFSSPVADVEVINYAKDVATGNLVLAQPQTE